MEKVEGSSPFIRFPVGGAGEARSVYYLPDGEVPGQGLADRRGPTGRRCSAGGAHPCHSQPQSDYRSRTGVASPSHRSDGHPAAVGPQRTGVAPGPTDTGPRVGAPARTVAPVRHRAARRVRGSRGGDHHDSDPAGDSTASPAGDRQADRRGGHPAQALRPSPGGPGGPPRRGLSDELCVVVGVTDRLCCRVGMPRSP